MHPVLTIGPWHVHAWGLLNALASAVVLVGALLGARRRAVPPMLLVRLWPWAILGGLVGGHLYYLAAASEVSWRALAPADVLDVVRGQAIQGGFLGGALATLLYVRFAGAPILAVLDVLAPAGAAAQALTRVGCFPAGCCYGRPAPTWLGVVYTDPRALGPRDVALYPAQLYESAALVALTVWLATRLWRSSLPNGRVFAEYLAGYGAIRFAVQFFRGDDAGHLVLGLAHSQYAALAMLATAAWLARTLTTPSGSAPPPSARGSR